MFKTENYNLLFTNIIGSIPYDINFESLQKLNITVDTLKKKETKKLNIKELDYLIKLIKKLKNSIKDEKLNEIILRNLKLFLVYGYITSINKNDITLSLKNNNITTHLTITITKNGITMLLKNRNYTEKAMLKSKDTFFYTKFLKKETKRIERTICTNYDIKKSETLRIFSDNIETFRKEETTKENYNKDKQTKVKVHTFNTNNNSIITQYFYRKDGYIIKKGEKKYIHPSLEKNSTTTYEISKDYNQNDTNINTTGYYGQFDKDSYINYLKGQKTLEKIYKKSIN